MKNESKIVELLSEMLRKFDVLTATVVNLIGRVDNLTDRVDNLTDRVDNLTTTVGKVESEIVKLNLISSENSRALLKLGDMMIGSTAWKKQFLSNGLFPSDQPLK